MKLDVETPATTPDAPPEAGPDRAFDPPPVAPLPGPGGADVAEGDAPQPAESPITAQISAAAIIDRCLIDSHRRTPGRRASLPVTMDADRSEDASVGGRALSLRPEPSAICGDGVALAFGHAVRV